MRFVRYIMDVTADVLGNVPSTASQSEYERITAENMKALTGRLQEEHPSMEISVKPFFGGNQFFAFVMEVYTDVRLVGAPPSSIGKFGGDTDNWIWPATPATSPYSASMHRRRTSRRPTRPTTFPTARRSSSPSRPGASRRATSR